MMIPILYLSDLDVHSVEKTYSKTLSQLQKGDFKSAEVKKMAATGYYRARLDIRDRLLFTFIRYNDLTHLLVLEVIKNHRYESSRFLQGATIPDEEMFIPVHVPTEITVSEKDMIYINPDSNKIHLLNKFISFDNIQNSIFSLHPPLIIVGSAGSGKTVLLLEKLKELHGEIAYISLSNFLVDNASRIYYSNKFENEKQDVEFLSLHNFLSSWEIPRGKEVDFPQFDFWYSRYAQAVKIYEPYRVFEEFRGVITGSVIHTGYLSKEEYMGLGVKQSIFSIIERERLYPLFLKYLEWLKDNNLYDSNLLCFQYLEKVKPRYDYIIIDEVQDITNVQLKCILASLKHKNHFILSGDSNQIVHPNFFSWSKLKSFFFESGDGRNPIKILQTNYRNSLKVVDLGNNLLKIKNSRFGSIDRESNYLIGTVSKNNGDVVLYPDEEKKKNELNRLTQNSTQYAVIVPDNESKREAKRFFKTPLIFSIQEAKGLEYNNVILLNFVSNHEAEFREIIKGVNLADLQKEDLLYNRAGDKHDKDAEIYKFFINSLYVAITRAVNNIYIFEKLSNHPALHLLQMHENKDEIKITGAKSSTEEWLQEAKRLEEQGKYEHAEQIRAKYLGFEYLTKEQLSAIRLLALDPNKKEHEVKKERKQLFQYALAHNDYYLIEELAKLQFQRAVLTMKEVKLDRKEYAKSIRLGHKTEVLRFAKKYGIDFRVYDDATGLMLALYHGQDDIISELIQLKPMLDLKGGDGQIHADYLLKGFLQHIIQKKEQTATAITLKRFWRSINLYGINYFTLNKNFSLNSHSMVCFLLLLLRVLGEMHSSKVTFMKGTPDEKVMTYFTIDDITNYVALIPDEILPPYRKNRQYISSILSSNEVYRQGYANCKMAFARVKRGAYVINPVIMWI